MRTVFHAIVPERYKETPHSSKEPLLYNAACFVATLGKGSDGSAPVKSLSIAALEYRLNALQYFGPLGESAGG